MRLVYHDGIRSPAAVPIHTHPGGRVSAIARRTVIVLIALAVLVGAPACGRRADTGLPSKAASSTDPGSLAYAIMDQFSNTVGPRPADTWGEIRAREFVFHAFQQYDYEPVLQEFIAQDGDGAAIHSANVIAVKPGESGATLVVGAHMDTVKGSPGALDNASGIGALLEISARVKDVSTPCTIAFVAFGAEEAGLLGSVHYVDALSDVERRAIAGMINLDSVAGGRVLYAYGDEAEGAWLLGDVLAIADRLQIEVATDALLQVKPRALGGVGYKKAGDHIPFASHGIPVAGFVAADEDLNAEGEPFFPMNTRRDTMATLQRRNPGQTRRQLHDVIEMLEVALTSKLAKQ